MSKYRIIGICVILAAAFTFLYSFNTYGTAFIIPDETINYTFSIQYRETGNLSYEEGLNDIITPNIIRPRGVLMRGGQMVPAKFLGLPLYYGALSTVDDALLFLLTPLLACLGALAVYLLGKELFDKSNGAISGILLLILPLYWYWANYPLMENVFAAAVFALGLVYFFRGLRIPSLKYYAFAALFLGIAWNVRPDTVLFLIPLLLLLIPYWKKVNPRYLVVSALVFGITVLPILLMNNQVYGIYLGEKANLITKPGNSVATMFINIEWLIKACPLLVLSVIGWFFCFRSQSGAALGESGLRRGYATFVLLSILIFSLFYLTGVLPKRPFPLHESYVRYLLPIYLASLPLFSVLIQRVWRLKKAVAVILILTFVSISMGDTASTLNEQWQVRKHYATIAGYIIDNTEPSAIVFIGGFDKFIFPERKVGGLFYLPREDRERVLAKIIFRLTAEELPLYIYQYKDGPDLNTLEKELGKGGLGLSRVNDGNLYKIISLASQQLSKTIPIP